jgi:hypothetical protein
MPPHSNTAPRCPGAPGRAAAGTDSPGSGSPVAKATKLRLSWAGSGAPVRPASRSGLRAAPACEPLRPARRSGLRAAGRYQRGGQIPSAWVRGGFRVSCRLSALSGLREKDVGTAGRRLYTRTTRGISSKCRSRLNSTRPCWTVRAAIQRSLVGIGVPAERSSANRSA